MRKERKVTVHGVTLTISAWARAMDISIVTIYRRVSHMGWSLEKAVSTPRMVKRYIPGMKFGKWTLVKNTGIKTESNPRYYIWEAVCECGFDAKFSVRLFSPSMEWRLPKCPKCDGFRIKAQGKNMTLREWSEETGMSIHTLRSRAKRGMNPEDIIELPIYYNSKFLTFNGETMSINQWAKRIGITRQGLGQRLKTMPLEKALTKPPMKYKTRGKK